MPDQSLVRFRNVVAASLAELESRRGEVNDLNVFPVADGDTGDNMAMTMRAVLDELDGAQRPADRRDRARASWSPPSPGPRCWARAATAA